MELRKSANAKIAAALAAAQERNKHASSLDELVSPMVSLTLDEIGALYPGTEDTVIVENVGLVSPSGEPIGTTQETDAISSELSTLRAQVAEKEAALKMLEERMYGEQFADGAEVCAFYRELRAVLSR